MEGRFLCYHEDGFYPESAPNFTHDPIWGYILLPDGGQL